MDIQKIFHNFITRVRLPGENEKEHAVVRLIVVVGVTIYFLLSELLTESTRSIPTSNLVIPAILVAISVALVYLVFRNPEGTFARRAATAFFDVFIISLGIYQAGGPGTILYPIYFLMIFGYGARYGNRILFLGAILAIIGFFIATEFSPYWSDKESLRGALIFGLALISVYSAVLLFRLKQERANAEEANNKKSQFVANIGHEFRTPLNAIIGYSEMLKEGLAKSGSSQAQKDLEHIRSSGHHLLDLVNNLMDISKIEAGKMEVALDSVDIGKILEEVGHAIKPMVEKNKNRLNLKWDSNLGTLQSDPTKIKQCLINLAGNAAKFTQNGEIEIKARREPGSDGERIVLTVRDTGIGMTADQTKRMFQDYMQAETTTQRDFGGTGLGLAITKRLCRLLGGDISVESTPDAGSIFTMWFPVEFPGSTTS